MTIQPELSSDNLNWVFENAGELLGKTRPGLSASAGEEGCQTFYDLLLHGVCDKVGVENFSVCADAPILLQKIFSLMLVTATVLFQIAVSFCAVWAADLALLFSLSVLLLFCDRFLLHKNKPDLFFKKKSSTNLFAVRYSSGTPTARVVFTSHADAPPKKRARFFGGMSPLFLPVLLSAGNMLLFIGTALFLFAGAPESSLFFKLLLIFSWAFALIDLCSFLAVNPKKSAAGAAFSVLPALTAISAIKQMSDENFRFGGTEICCLITGSEYADKAGARAFAEKYKKLLRDVPTVFVSIDSLTSLDALTLFTDRNAEYSDEAEKTLENAADDLNLKLHKENEKFASASSIPFSAQRFSACSFGASKKSLAKLQTSSAPGIEAVEKETVAAAASLLLQTANYFGDVR